MTVMIQCRLRTSYIDQETGERMCIYQRGATGQGDMTTSMSKTVEIMLQKGHQLQDIEECGASW